MRGPVRCVERKRLPLFVPAEAGITPVAVAGAAGRPVPIDVMAGGAQEDEKVFAPGPAFDPGPELRVCTTLGTLRHCAHFC